MPKPVHSPSNPPCHSEDPTHLYLITTPTPYTDSNYRTQIKEVTTLAVSHSHTPVSSLLASYLKNLANVGVTVVGGVPGLTEQDFSNLRPRKSD